MTVGFGRGFVHGAVIALMAAGLAMVMAPRPAGTPGQAPLIAAVPVPANGQSDAPQFSPQRDGPSGAAATSPTGAASDGPSEPRPGTRPGPGPGRAAPEAPAPDGGLSSPGAPELPAPAGSEFRRGADTPPAAPRGGSAADRARNAIATPAALDPPPPHPARETAPPQVEAATRPLAAQAPATPPAPKLVEVAPDWPTPPHAEAPIPVAPPGRVASPALDHQPGPLSEAPPALAALPAGRPSDPGSAPGSQTPAASAPSATVAQPAPVQPARPAPDLALPPDLGRLAVPAR